jgi:ubiquinone/menaquinone biosynthesis C-methylase UbiE
VLLPGDSTREEEPKIGRYEPQDAIYVARDEYETTRQNEELWDARAETYDTRYSFTRWTQRKLVSLLQLSDNPCLLDLACGTGWALWYAASRTNGQGEFYGVDNSSKMIEQAKAKSQGCGHLHFYKSRAEELPFDDDFFDVVISSNSFHHFSNPEKALREANRVLKLRGKLYILDMTANGALMRFLDRYFRKIEPAHVKLYSTKEFQALFERAGLCYITSKRIIPTIEVHVAIPAEQG